jgi:hypothetical protein
LIRGDYDETAYFYTYVNFYWEKNQPEYKNSIIFTAILLGEKENKRCTIIKQINIHGNTTNERDDLTFFRCSNSGMHHTSTVLAPFYLLSVLSILRLQIFFITNYFS